MILLDKIKNDKYSINVLFAILCTLIIFGVFVGQAFTSSVTTFCKAGDGDKQCYAVFMKIRECMINGESFVGVDSGSYNGATEFFLRSNIPGAYILLYLFALLAIFLPARGMYIMFYAFHMFIALFIMQKVGRKYFGFNNRIAMVVSALYLYLLCVAAWYISWYIIASLTVILFYFSLEFFYNRSIRTMLQLILGCVLSLTSGYITVSVVMFIGVYFLSLIYIFADLQNRNIKQLGIYTVPYIVGGLITLPWLLQMYSYTDKVVGAGSSISDTIARNLDLSDIFNIVSGFSFEFTKPLESISMISFGLVTFLILCYAIKDFVIRNLVFKERLFIITCFCCFVFIILWSSGSSTAVAGFLYNLLPVLGRMHLQNRYFVLILPFLYISLGKLTININWMKHRKSLKWIAVSLIAVLLLYLILVKSGVQIKFVKQDHFIIEMMITLLFIWVVQWEADFSKNKYLGRRGAIIWMFSVLIASTTYFYNNNGVYSSLQEIENRSILYNGSAQVAIDNYITETKSGRKDVYRIVSYDSKESVPGYLLGNYEWYNYSIYNLCNYSGYEIHLCVPEDYRSHNPWFNNFDWEYLADTRADYMMTDWEAINSKRDFFDEYIDWEKGTADLGNGRIMVSLFQFIPSTIAGEKNIHDKNNSLDNGYFYSHDLKNEEIVSFYTDQNSYYELSVNSDNPALLAFLPYANRYYHYYIDSVEVIPEIVNMQAILSLEGGNHVIRIIYENIMGTVGFWMIIGSGALLMISIAFLQVLAGRKKRNERKN